MATTLDTFGSPTVADWIGATIDPDDLAPRLQSTKTLDDALRVVMWDWANRGAHGTQTLARMGEAAIRLARRLTVTGVTAWNAVGIDDCRGFVDARTAAGDQPSTHTRHFRRSTIRCIYRSLRALGARVGDPTLDFDLTPRTNATARPLTDDEITLLRTVATLGRSTYAPVTLALAEATALTSEIPHLRLGDLDDISAPTTVALPGTSRHDERTGVLTDWGRTVLTRHVATIDGAGDTRLAYRGAARPGSISPQASACNHLGGLLRTVGLNREPDVRPNSIRHWSGRALYDAGQPLDVVAGRLGFRSLDLTAEAIDLDWRTTTEELGS